MASVALVAHSGAPDLYDDDRLLIPALAARGIEAGPVLWDDPAADWAAFGAVIIREPWDYLPRSLAPLDRRRPPRLESFSN